MKKALQMTGKVASTLIFIFAIFVMVFTIISVNTVGRDDTDFLGYKPYIILSDSMSEEFSAGDLGVSKIVDPSTLQVGDIVTFKSIDPDNYDTIVTHKIREITTYNGESAFITYGTTTGSDDAYPVPFSNVIGKYQFKLPYMGYFFEFLRTPMGYFVLILIPFLILITIEAVRFFKLFKQYKQEQKEELAMSNAAYEAQKEETERVKEELERLKAQLDAQTS